jgi:hypothetical protein
MKEHSIKFEIEVALRSDGRIFLEYEDWARGQDVTAELVSGKLLMGQDQKEITLLDFLAKVKLIVDYERSLNKFAEESLDDLPW